MGARYVVRLVWTGVASSALLLASLARAQVDAGSGLDGGSPSADCGLQIGYAGDARCLLPPSPGFQIHLGPADYDNPDDVAAFIMAPGEETIDCFFLQSPNATTLYSRLFEASARPGLLRGTLFRLAEGTAVTGGLGACDDALAGAEPIASFTGPSAELTPSAGPEYADLAWEFLPNTALALRTHWVNTTPEPTLKEVWWNVNGTEASGLEPVRSVELVGRGDPVPPASTVLHTFGCDAPDGANVIQVTADISANVVRLSAFVVRADGSRTLVYETYDWTAPVTLSYDSQTSNPDPDPQTGTSGGFSGALELRQGDRLEWECELENMFDTPLTYDEASIYFSSRCSLFGTSDVAWSCFDGPVLQDAGVAMPAGGAGGASMGSVGAGATGAGGAPSVGGSGPAAPIDGTSGSGGAVDVDAGEGASPGLAKQGTSSAESSGCGCRLAPGRVSSASWAALLALVIAGRRRKGRRSASQ